MSQPIALYRIYDLPWSTGAEQESKFRQLLGTCVAAMALLALILSFLPLPQRSPDEVHEIPKRLARLVVERQQPPPPTPVNPTRAPTSKPRLNRSGSNMYVLV